MAFVADGVVQPAPMRVPPGAWALLVTAADRSVADGEVLLFAGTWHERDFESSGAEGDLVVQLHHAGSGADDSDGVEIRMLRAHGDGREAIRTWPRLDRRWPVTVAAAAVVLSGDVDSASLCP